MKGFLLTAMGCIFCCLLSAQNIDEGFLTFKETPSVIAPGSPLYFSLVDTSASLPDNTIIRVDWLDEKGHLLDFSMLKMISGSVCFTFINNRILRGPTLLRGYFFNNGKPFHIARQFVHIDAARKPFSPTIPDELQPLIINRPFVFADTTYSYDLVVKEKYKSAPINYQITDEKGDLESLGVVDRINDTLLRIKDLDYVGRGSIRVYLNNEMEYRDYDKFILDWATPIGSVVWGDDTISSRSMGFVASLAKHLKNELDRRNAVTGVTTYSKDGIPDVVVTGIRKSRKQQIVDKYINNGIFRDINTLSVIVYEDPMASTSMNLHDYLLFKFPILQPRNGQLTYRGSPVAFYLDEVYGGDLTGLNIRDVAVVNFIKASVRGLVGPSAGTSVGTSLGSANLFGGEGATGTIVVYTKKGNEEDLDLKLRKVSLPLVGISVADCTTSLSMNHK